MDILGHDEVSCLMRTSHFKMNYIQQYIDQYPVLLFMKGTPENPYCGFSKGVVKILETLNVQFHGIDVLEDPQLREDLKQFSQWPTFPQVYIAGQFVGGYDIIKEMYETQELLAMIHPYRHENLA